MSRYLKKGIIMSLLLMLVLSAVILIMNSSPFDQTLDPEVARLIEDTSTRNIADSDNAYYTLMGIYSPGDTDPNTAGRNWVNHFNTTKHVQRTEVVKTMKQGLQPSMLEIPGLNYCERSANSTCIQLMTENRSRIEPLATEYKVYLQRYENLLQSRHFQETITPDLNAPILPNILPLESLFLAVSYTQNMHHPEAFFTALEQHLEFWRILLTQSDSLVAKMQSAHSILLGIKILSEYMTVKDMSDSQIQRIKAMLMPLSEEEKDISEAFAYELKAMANTIFSYANGDEISPQAMSFRDRFMRQLTQPNATVNILYSAFIRDLIALSSLPTQDFKKAVNNIDLLKKVPVEISRSWNPYNYGGRELLAIAVPDFIRYIESMHDLDGMLRLTTLQLQIKADTSQPGIQNMVNTSEMQDAYNFTYDAQSRRLYFTCYRLRNTCAVVL